MIQKKRKRTKLCTLADWALDFKLPKPKCISWASNVALSFCRVVATYTLHGE